MHLPSFKALPIKRKLMLIIFLASGIVMWVACAALISYDVFWFRLGFRIVPEMFQPGMKCKIIATPVTGLNHIDEEACRRFGVLIVSLRGAADFQK